MGRLTPIVELGLAEAFAILTEQLGVSRESLSPLDAIENEDWGRDLLLSKLQAIDLPRGAARASAPLRALLEPPGAYRRKARRETRKQRPDWA